ECGSLFDLNKPPCSGQPAPGEQLARRQPIPPRRRRHNPRRAVALRHDPLLLRQRPAPPGTCRNNLEPRDLRNRRMVSHTPMSSPSARITQGGARRSDTMYLAGVSVRRVEDITEALWGTRVSPSTVSDLNKKIYGTIAIVRSRATTRMFISTASCSSGAG